MVIKKENPLTLGAGQAMLPQPCVLVIRRLTRLTDGHSKKWENHEAALAFFFAYYNFCRVHMTLKQTPAMKAGLTDHPWSLKELLQSANRLTGHASA